MSFSESLLHEFDNEMATARRLLERVPEADTAWKPHPKSMPLGYLAMHLATLPGWMVMIFGQSELDFNPPGGPQFKVPDFTTTANLLEVFDKSVADAHAALVAGTGADPMEPWTLKSAEQVLFTMPRAAVARTFCMNHFIHHRGQLSVYLRLRDVPLPSTYGPSADTAAEAAADSLKRHGDALVDGSGSR
ncbi:MAG: DUF664 domain-containing protein [Gemmatimonadales bacterium]|nr:DUF664 domain-containing protein [Gemmatimonadales bacterium]